MVFNASPRSKFYYIVHLDPVFINFFDSKTNLFFMNPETVVLVVSKVVNQQHWLILIKKKYLFFIYIQSCF